MVSRLSRSRKFRQCTACRQLILPGEVYTDQRWAPWECDSDGYWWVQPACRWCAEGYWKHDDGDGWSDDWASTWMVTHEVNRGYCHRCRGVRAEAAAEVVL